MPLGIPPSTSVRSFVAMSSLKMSSRWRLESAMRASTLSPYFDAMKRCVSLRRRSEAGGRRLEPATAGIEETAYELNGRNAAANHILQRRASPKDRVAIRQRHPAVGERFTVEDVERLEDADQIRDPQHCIRIERASRRLFHRVVRAARHPAEEPHRILIAQLPEFHDVEKGFQRRRAQPRALLARRDVDELGRGVAGLRIGEN